MHPIIIIYYNLNITMILNIIVAFSNIPCIYPILLSLKNRDHITTIAITYVAAASFLSHLVENHKHGMPGIGFSKQTSYMLNRLDVAGCFIMAFRIGYIYFSKYGFSFDTINKNKFTFMLYFLPFILMRISEYDKYNPNLRSMYIITHSIWHISIFSTIHHFLKNFIYY